MKMHEAIDWAIDALQSRLDELGSGWTYDQTLEAARVLGDFKKDPLIAVSTEITTTYLPSEDVTVIWQHVYICRDTLQRAIIGWYYGEPNDAIVQQYSNMPLIAQFYN